MNIDAILTQGHIASALLIIAAVLAYYVFEVADKNRKGKSTGR